jgi:hypothetical protein
MHRLAQFRAISRPSPAPRTGPAPWDGQLPPDGNLPAELLRILCAALAEHTSTPDSCWFCLWDGYGLFSSASLWHATAGRFRQQHHPWRYRCPSVC